MKNHILFIAILLISHFSLNANILCPPDKHLTCYDDIHYLPLTGEPTVIGGTGQLRYFDQKSTSMCNVGHIRRFWYLDANGNESLDSNEESCVQNLYVAYSPGEISITWPQNKTVECVEDIPNDLPSWVSGPCDMIGVSKTDEILRTGNSACYKIMRHFKVINWCMEGQGQNEWNHTQMISIVDNSRPSLRQCGEVIIGTDVGCKATFTVSNSAIDISPCGEQILRWKADVDLWNDGTIDYTYTADHIDPRFKLKNTVSGEEIAFTLPELVMTGWHKVTWTVNDMCGNATKCEQKIRVQDTKKPTPYLFQVLSTAFEGRQHPIRVNAKQFNHSSFDNCTKSSLLRYSFSKDVNDTIRIINCNNAGFQFYQIYVTDLEGNQEYAEVYLLAFDNGACANTRMISGTIHEANGHPINGAHFKLTQDNDPDMELMTISNIHGVFDWENISIYNDMAIVPEYDNRDVSRIDIADLKMLQDHITGDFTLTNYQLIAADIDGDSRIRAKDLMVMRDILLGKTTDNDPWILSTFPDSIVQPVHIKEFYDHSDIQLKTIKYPLNFKGVYRGDISDANESVTESRNSYVMNKKVEENGDVLYFLPTSVQASGIQLSFSGIDLEQVEILSPYFDVSSENVHFENGNIRVVTVKDMDINPDMPLIRFTNMKNDQQNTLTLNNISRILLNGYVTGKLIEREARSDQNAILLTPNPSNDYFEISKATAKVIQILNQTGKQVSFTQQGSKVNWDAPIGVYFVMLEDSNQLITLKMVKH